MYFEFLVRIRTVIAQTFILVVTFSCKQEQTATGHKSVAAVQSPPQKSVAAVQSPPQKPQVS